MAFRCINAFTNGTRTVAGGALVEDDDPILNGYREFFRPVDIPAKLGSETATAGTRSKSAPKKQAPKPADPTLPVEAPKAE